MSQEHADNKTSYEILKNYSGLIAICIDKLFPLTLTKDHNENKINNIKLYIANKFIGICSGFPYI